MLGLKKADWILVAALLIISLGALALLPRLFGDGDQAREVVVTMDGTEIFRTAVPPAGNAQRSFPFTVDDQEYQGTLEFDDGSVRLQRLPQDIVPLAIHHDMGPIVHTYQSIVALPVRMLVRLETTEPEEFEFDIVAY